MIFTAANLHLHPISLQPIRSTLIPQQAQTAARPPSAGRRECLLFTATTMLTATAVSLPSAEAKDIPMFGLRNKLQKAEEKTEELAKESFETLEKDLEIAEEEVVVAAENASFGGLAQAGVVAAAEVLGLLIATSFVNGILGSKPQKS